MEETIELNGHHFRVLKLLGKGKGGYSYLVEENGKKFVLKQIHHEPCSYYRFGDKLQSELRDYQRLNAIGIPMPKLLGVDKVNERILKEYIDGKTIYDLVKNDRMKKEYFDQIHAICDLLYPSHTNIDYFPTNFVVQEGKIYYIDFECNDYMAEWDFEHWGIQYWSKTPAFLAYLSEHE